MFNNKYQPKLSWTYTVLFGTLAEVFLAIIGVREQFCESFFVVIMQKKMRTPSHMAINICFPASSYYSRTSMAVTPLEP